MTRALVLSEHDLDAWGERFTRGEVPSPLPYGADTLTDVGWSLSWARRAVDPPWRRWRDVVEHRAGYPVERAIRGARDARRADVVLALLEQQGAAASVMRRAKLPPYGSTPLVVWSVWLADELRSADAQQKRRLVRRYAGADLITHMSVHETEVFEEAGIPRDRTLPVRFGVNDDFYTPGDGRARHRPAGRRAGPWPRLRHALRRRSRHGPRAPPRVQARQRRRAGRPGQRQDAGRRPAHRVPLAPATCSRRRRADVRPRLPDRAERGAGGGRQRFVRRRDGDAGDAGLLRGRRSPAASSTSGTSTAGASSSSSCGRTKHSGPASARLRETARRPGSAPD